MGSGRFGAPFEKANPKVSEFCFVFHFKKQNIGVKVKLLNIFTIQRYIIRF